MIAPTRSIRPHLCLGLLLFVTLTGCGGSKWAGDWHGVRVPPAGANKVKQRGYSETKRSVDSTLSLSGDGSYTAKFEEINYTGDWKQEGQTITLTPKTYMGMERDKFPKTKDESSPETIDKLYQPYVLETASDGKMTHKDEGGTVTFSKAS